MGNLTSGRAKELLKYSPETGLFYINKMRRGCRRIDKPLGTLTSEGYLKIFVDGKQHYLHRLAWLIYYGVHPSGMVDHVNRDRTDNRISNLRVADFSENGQNRTVAHGNSHTGFLGVSKHGRSGLYRSRIYIKGKKYELGIFETPEEAHAAYLRKKKESHPFFSGE